MPGDSTAFEKLRSSLALDSEGGLTLNGMPMILLPRHFFRYILREVHKAAGPETFRRIFRQAGHDGALAFCRRYRETFRCTPLEAVQGYLAEMSLRGWGRFRIAHLTPQAGEAEIVLENSALVAEDDLPSGHIIWEGAALGAITFLRESGAGVPDGELTSHGEELPPEAGRPASHRILVRCGPNRNSS
jgi:hypothetical protein